MRSRLAFHRRPRGSGVGAATSEQREGAQGAPDYDKALFVRQIIGLDVPGTIEDQRIQPRECMVYYRGSRAVLYEPNSDVVSGYDSSTARTGLVRRPNE